MFFTLDSDKPTAIETVKMIEKIVYARLKPLGFKKHGRLLHRFVDGDISQVVRFSSELSSDGSFDALWIGHGIRVPECQLRKFIISEPLKKYYDLGECNLKSGLCGTDAPGTWFLLHKREREELINNIMEQLEKTLIPTFETLNSRDNIIKYRKEYPDYMFFHLMILEEAMIWGRRGDLAQASRLFQLHYQNALAEYQDKFENGYQEYLHKGQSVSYFNPKTKQSESVCADHDGYYTIFGAYRGHLNHLEQLAAELGIDLACVTKDV